MLGLARSLFGRRDGAVAVEYALLVAVVGGSMALGSAELGEAIATALTSVSDLITG